MNLRQQIIGEALRDSSRRSCAVVYAAYMGCGYTRARADNRSYSGLCCVRCGAATVTRKRPKSDARYVERGWKR